MLDGLKDGLYLRWPRRFIKVNSKEFDEINNGDIDTIIAESKLKSSINFKSKVDEYLKYLEKNYLPKEDFILENVRIMRYENIQNLFAQQQYNQAKNLVCQFLTHQPQNPTALEILGCIYFYENDFYNAKKFLKNS